MDHEPSERPAHQPDDRRPDDRYPEDRQPDDRNSAGPRPRQGLPPYGAPRGPRPPAYGARGPAGRQQRPGARPAAWAATRPGPPRGPGPDAARQDPTLELGEGEELVAGRRPVQEAFIARRTARRLLVVPQRRHALEQLVLHATSLRIPVVEVEGGTLTAVAGFDGHQGIALVVDTRRWSTPAEILARAAERDAPPLVLVLDSLEDPQNLGTLLRTAEASGVHGAVFPTRRQAPLSPAAVKASAGAVEHLLLAPVDDLPGALADLHVRGLRIVGADGDAPLTARDADLRGPIAIVVGSEGRGLSAAVRRRCDLLVRIPMHGRIESLNAAVAGSILLYEAAAQRRLPESVPMPLTTELIEDTPEPPGAVEASTEPVSPESLASPASTAQPESMAPLELSDAPASPEPPAESEAEPTPSKPKRPRKPRAGSREPAPDPLAAASAEADAEPPVAEPSAAAVAEAPPEPAADPQSAAAEPKPKRARKPRSTPAKPPPDDPDLLPGEPAVEGADAPAAASDGPAEV